MHYILLAHAKSLEVLRDYKQKNLGIVLNKSLVQPVNSQPMNLEASKAYNEIHNLWFDEAIFKGKYPDNMLRVFDSYMPNKFQDDLKLISKRIDWLGINYYTRSIVSFDRKESNFNFKLVNGSLPKTDMGWEIFPEGLSLVLLKTINNYSKDLPIHITENGMANNDIVSNKEVHDDDRVDFFASHIEELYKLVQEGFPIKSYFAWSLLDNFEWSYGYDKRFGLVYVDYKNQKRLPKSSWHQFQKALLN